MRKKSNSKDSWKTYFAYYRDKKGAIFFALTLAIVQSFILIPSTFLVKEIFDVGLIKQDLYLILENAVVVVVLIITNQIIWLWVRKMILNITKQIIEEIRTKLLSGLLYLDYSVFQSFPKDELHSRVVNDSERIDRMSNAFVASFLPSLISSVCLLGILFYLDWRLTLVLTMLGPFLYLVMKLLSKKIGQNTRASNSNFSIFSGNTHFIIRFFDLIKSSGHEAEEEVVKHNNLEDLKRSSIAMAWQHSLFKSLQDIIISCISLMILVLGCYFVINEQMSFGTLMSFYFVLYLLRRLMFNLTQSIPEILSGKESLEPILNLLEKFDLQRENTDGDQIHFDDAIQLRDINFGYAPDKPLFHGLNFRIDRGKTYAVIGSNGIGKSTLVKLIMGFYRPESGQILIGETALSSISIQHWRKQIGLIFQEPNVISDITIKENIFYGHSEELEENRFDEILKLSTLAPVIEQLPNGIDTMLSGGLNLSGGEKQKIAIARALMSQPKLLILDEPTNHLDAASLKALYHNLKNLWFNPSILIITHNKDFLQLADEVYELQEGSMQKVDLKDD
ncbi:MAG: ABC transporter ATP-binding protein [Reichenbachiella sp.]|uniref:ABC transporter ATP-binding protein n=1 Tax=Reichenbachiella sp. TaxID=2184521 RepID=UPI003265DF6A